MSPQEGNAALNGINTVAAALRFERQQQRKGEEERMIEQLEQIIASNARMRALLVERGLMPASEAMPPGRAPLN